MKNKIETLAIFISMSLALGSCSGPVPHPNGDSGPDADADLDQDDAEAEPDADLPGPDGEAPSCDPPGPETELTPAPSRAASPMVAGGPDGIALAWLGGDRARPDVMAMPLGPGLEPASEPLVLATERVEPTLPTIVWHHGSWLVLWADGTDDPTCTAASCRRTLRAARMTTAGLAEGTTGDLWPSFQVISGPAVAVTAGGAVVALGALVEGVARISAGRLDAEGRALGDVAVLVPDRTVRQGGISAARVGDRVIVVCTVIAGGLVATSVRDTDLETVAGPVEAVLDVSASSPRAASSGSTAAIVYLEGEERGSSVRLLEVDADLVPVAPPVVVSPGAHWPRQPAVVSVPPGWVIAWHDGRNDLAADCVSQGFCRNDTFLQTASFSGPAGEALRLSVDPNDCIGASLGVFGAEVTAAWLTYRDDRRTAFARQVRCQ